MPDLLLDRRALDLFTEIVELAPAERDRRLRSACQGSDELYRRVTDLLAADQDCLASDSDPELGHQPLGIEPESLPMKVGPWELTELLGSGGMGTVFEARRCDGLFEQHVAIKFFRFAGEGPGIEALIAQERRLLARMDHPSIARILEGGTTDQGTRFMVMEMVEGQPLDAFARERGLDLRSRVRIVFELCAALRHAHQNLVVHCDIKPSNILVSPSGQPKLIDFGVARIVGAPDGLVPQGLTRRYASPERLRGEPPASLDDLYSLAVVLAELVEDTVPEGGPIDGQSSSEVPALALSSGSQRELFAILGRALHPNRENRYPSLSAFERELDCWLNQRPVEAYGGGYLYPFRKMLQRHFIGSIVAGLAVLSLLIGAASTTFLYQRSEKARVHAARDFAEARALAQYLLLERTPELRDAQQEALSFVDSSSDASVQARAGAVALRSVLTEWEALAFDSSEDPIAQLRAATTLRLLAELELRSRDLVAGCGTLRKAVEAWTAIDDRWSLEPTLLKSELEPVQRLLVDHCAELDG